MSTTYRDTLVTCQECGKQFIYPVEKQRKLAEQGQPATIPSLCDACTARVKYSGKHHGRIKWFSLEKGYGFIAADGGGEIFLHRQGILLTDAGSLPPLEDGQAVLYEVMDTPKGPQAVQVTPYSE